MLESPGGLVKNILLDPLGVSELAGQRVCISSEFQGAAAAGLNPKFSEPLGYLTPFFLCPPYGTSKKRRYQGACPLFSLHLRYHPRLPIVRGNFWKMLSKAILQVVFKRRYNLHKQTWWLWERFPACSPLHLRKLFVDWTWREGCRQELAADNILVFILLLFSAPPPDVSHCPELTLFLAPRKLGSITK